MMYNLTIFIKNVFRYQTATFNNRKTNYVCTNPIILQVHKKLLFFFLNFIYFRQCWILTATQAFLQLWQVEATLQLWCAGFSLQWLLLLRFMGSKAEGLQKFGPVGSVVGAPRLQSTGAIVVAHGLSCSTVCGIFPDQGWNLCLLHWQADSLPLSYQGSPYICI